MSNKHRKPVVNVDAEAFQVQKTIYTSQCYLGQAVVYVVAPETKSRCKIGMSGNVRRRIRTLEAHSGIKMELLARIDSCCDVHARQIESSVIYQLRHRRSLGEWFELGHGEIMKLADHFNGIQKVVSYYQEERSCYVTSSQIEDELRECLRVSLEMVDCIEQIVLNEQSASKSDLRDTIYSLDLVETPYSRQNPAVLVLVYMLAAYYGSDSAYEITGHYGQSADSMIRRTIGDFFAKLSLESKLDSLNYLKSLGLVCVSKDITDENVYGYKKKGMGNSKYCQYNNYEITIAGIKIGIEIILDLLGINGYDTSWPNIYTLGLDRLYHLSGELIARE